MSRPVLAAAAPADHEVRRRICSELSATLFVEAGAGSGKTTVLVDRLLELFIVEGVRPRQIAAITFTEVAATELRDRIRERLERRAAEQPEVRDRCEEALADLDRAVIGTLHGFALRILTEHATAAGLPPRITVLDEVASQLAHEERWKHFVDALYDDPANEELLLRANVLTVRLESSTRGHATLAQAASVLAQSWDRLDRVGNEQHPPLAPIDFGSFDRAVAELEEAASQCSDADDTLATHLDRTLPQMRAIVATDDEVTKLEALWPGTPKKPRWGKTRLGSKSNWACDPADVRELIAAVTSAARAVWETAAADVIRRLVTLIAGDLLGAANERRREGMLEFHDLLVLAQKLLRDHAPTRRALHDRFRCLLLDEFQDTDPLQIELATLIAGTIGAERPEAWHDIDVEGGRLFFVGDPKQSIYRFRRADIGLFLDVQDRFGHDVPLSLTSNFRSVEPVVSWLNELFASVMAEQVERAQPRYEALHAERAASKRVEHQPVLLGGPLDALAPELRTREAADVARVLGDVAARPERWPVQDRETGAWRDARMSDVTVLLPTRTSLPFLLPALDAAAVPYRLDTGSLVFATQEISDVLAVVRAIADTTDTISLVAALRSPLYACSDVDLFTFHRARGRFDIAAEVPSDVAEVPGSRPVAEAMAHLKSLWQQRSWIGPATLVDRIVRERQALLAAFGATRPREVWRRLRFLVDQARAFEDSGQRDLRRFVEWAGLQRTEGARVHEPLLRETDEESVRVMTVHGAKGLEFGITVVSGMTTVATSARPGARVIWNDDAGGCEVSLTGATKTDDFDRRADLEEEMDVYEKRRLLYVALTRARDHLVVSAFHKESAKPTGSHGELVWQQCQGFRDRWRHIDDVVPRSDEASDAGDAASLAGASPRSIDLVGAEEERRRWIERRAAVRARNVQPHVLSATGVARLGVPPIDEQQGDAAEGDDVEPGELEPEDDPATPRWRRGRAGTAIGRAVHATLQSLDLSIDADDELVDSIAAREAALEVVPELAGQVAANVRSALRSEAVALARAHPHHKELFVAAPVGDRAVEGYIDLLVETPEGLVVVDYKTDSVASVADVDAKLDYYEVQGAVYATALERATGLPVVGCRFVFCRASGAIERSVADLEGAMRRVSARLDTA